MARIKNELSYDDFKQPKFHTLMTCEKVGHRVGLTPQQVNKIEKETIQKIVFGLIDRGIDDMTALRVAQQMFSLPYDKLIKKMPKEYVTRLRIMFADYHKFKDCSNISC